MTGCRQAGRNQTGREATRDGSGLVCEPDSTGPGPGGRFSFTLDPSGHLKGALFFAGHEDEFWGAAKDALNRPVFVDAQLRGWVYSILIMRGDFWDGTLDLVMTAKLQLDFTTGHVTGTLTNERYWKGVRHPGTWAAPMEGYRKGLKDYPTLVLAGTEGTTGPAGAGFARGLPPGCSGAGASRKERTRAACRSSF